MLDYDASTYTRWVRNSGAMWAYRDNFPCNDWMVTPLVQLPDSGDGLQLIYDYKATSLYDYGEMEVRLAAYAPGDTSRIVDTLDFFTLLLASPFQKMHALPVRILVLAVGCVILAYGMTIVIKSDAGTGPNDLVAIVISDKLHQKFSVVRIVVDVCFVAAGWLLGGTFGLGTIICAALVGPVAGLFLPRNERIIEGIIRRALSRQA